jgi:NADH:ubiquinone reductase (H+-translocating)
MLMQTARTVLIAGGGIAGLTLATRLGHSLGRTGKARIALVDRSPTHVWKPMLHTFAAGTWNVHQQQLPYLAHARQHHFEYIPGEIDALDTARRQLGLAPMVVEGETLIDRRELTYDALILAVGSQANDFATPGVAEHCHFIDSQAEAESFNARLRARVVRSVAQNDHLRVAIVGAGATGVELAAELSRLLELASGYGIRFRWMVAGGDVRSRLQLTLLESGPRILGAFPEAVSASTAEQLRHVGVDIRTGVRVVAAEAGGLVLEDGERVPAELMVWAAGVKAPGFLAGIEGLPRNRVQQVRVHANLQVEGEPHIFAVGDCASLMPDGAARPLPPTAQVANQQALHLARHFPGWLLKGRELPDFRYRDFGSLVSLSGYNAFGTLGKFGFFRGGFIKGRFAQLSHALLYRRHQIQLHGLARSILLWGAERLNGLVGPRIRLS